MNKQALDQKAKDYWTDYFKTYGQMWIRDIPRRIKQGMRRDLKAETIEGDIAPLAHDIGKDQTLSIEAAFVGKIDGADARALVTAEFSSNGTLNKMDITRVN